MPGNKSAIFPIETVFETFSISPELKKMILFNIFVGILENNVYI